MGRRILNRKDLRADFDAAERKKQEEDELEEEEGDEDEDEDEDEEGEDAEDKESDSEGETEDEDDELKILTKPKKKAAPKAPKPAKSKPRSRSAKTVRMKVVWGVFNNSNVRVAVYDYPKRKEADDHAARLTNDKKQTHFVQPVKEPFEEKANA